MVDTPSHKLVHYVHVSVFCKAYEQTGEVLAGLDLLSPAKTADLLLLKKEYDNERPKTTFYRAKDVELTVAETQSDDGMMTIYTLFCKKQHDTTSLMHLLASNIPAAERARIAKDPLDFVDEEGRFVLRLDKRDLMNKKFTVVDHGDCYLIRAAIAAYPKTYEAVEDTLKKIFS